MASNPTVDEKTQREGDDDEKSESEEEFYSSSDEDDSTAKIEEESYSFPDEDDSTAKIEEESHSFSDEDDSRDGEDNYKDRSPEANFRRFAKALDDPGLKKHHEDQVLKQWTPQEIYDFPKDPEKWTEDDLREYWARAPRLSSEPGWDPVWADDEDWEAVTDQVTLGDDPSIAPFYVPYRRCYPVIPNNHRDISHPKAVVEELDRIEEFMTWVSFIFEDGSSYEGTVFDDLAHGKGVYVGEQGLVRYEGEWLRNLMQGHGVVEVEVPDIEPAPGSKLEEKMRAEGRIISRDFKSPKDKQWLEMDIEDSFVLAGDRREIPFYEREAWVRIFGQKPEKGRYRYAGQWKHGRMHGCGVYEVNERIIYGRFYFGEHVEDSAGCDSNVSALHAGIAEVAAAKARMFTNKPDGMVREERGPYGDPQHPYFYEEDDVWMAPGFINQFYDVPDYWKTYVEEVDQEREMWLNSFHKAPLRIPMPAELEYWWSRDQGPEFVLVNKEPEPDPEDPSNLIYTEDPLILHTPTGRLINYVEDEEHGVRLFWQPRLEEGEDVDPKKAMFLPLGLDEFYGRNQPRKKLRGFGGLIKLMEDKLKPLFDRLERWVEEKRKASELKRELIKMELDLIEAEICLEEALEDRENELKLKQKEEEEKAAAGKDGDQVSGEAGEDEADSEDEEEGDVAPTSFGTVQQEETDENENKSAKSPFSSITLSVASPGLISMVTSRLQNSFLSWERARHRTFMPDLSSDQNGRLMGDQRKLNSVSFPRSSRGRANLKVVVQQQPLLPKINSGSRLRPLARIVSSQRTFRSFETRDHGSKDAAAHNLSMLSLHVPVGICTLS